MLTVEAVPPKARDAVRHAIPIRLDASTATNAAAGSRHLHGALTRRGLLPVAGVALTFAALIDVAAQPGVRRFSLEDATGLRPHNVTVSPATMGSRAGVRMTISDEARARFTALTPEQRELATRTGQTLEQLAVIEGVSFDNGTIEAEIAGAPQTGTFEGARGFVGIAFRVQDDLRTYDAFYLRPTNGRADDQVRRNHSVQYISHPEWTWSRLRTESPKKYESYVDLEPGVWTTIRIEVQGTRARLFVHGQPQPTLIVNDLKTGDRRRGGIALWIDVGTEAHFRNVVVTPATNGSRPF